VPELQVGQLSNDEVAPAPDPMLNEKEDSSFRGLGAWHLGQFRWEPFSPKDWRASNFSPHWVHWYS